MKKTLLLAACLVLCACEKDDTDPPDGRSGLGLRVDHDTGCHYLVTPRGGITPRLLPNGKQVCPQKPALPKLSLWSPNRKVEI